MRINGGEFRGRMLRTPRGEATRPTSGLVRETLFNILAAEVQNASVLDLYAGCGSVGLEALGRGAARAVMVENARQALSCLHANIEMLRAASKTVVIPAPVARALEALIKAGELFDIIFVDPPFADVESYEAVLRKAPALLAEDGVLVAQHDTRLAMPQENPGLEAYRTKQMGDNALTFYRRDKQKA